MLRLLYAVASLSGREQIAALLKWPNIRDVFLIRQHDEVGGAWGGGWGGGGVGVGGECVLFLPCVAVVPLLQADLAPCSLQWRAPKVNETCCRRPQLAALLTAGVASRCRCGVGRDDACLAPAAAVLPLTLLLPAAASSAVDAVAANGPDALYTGATAQALAGDIKAAGGCLQMMMMPCACAPPPGVCPRSLSCLCGCRCRCLCLPPLPCRRHRDCRRLGGRGPRRASPHSATHLGLGLAGHAPT